MEWKTNLSNDLMMLNAPVTFIGTEEGQLIKKFTMRIPTVFEVYTDQDLQLFSSLLHADIQKLEQQFPIVKNLSTHFQLMKILLVYEKLGTKQYIDAFVNSMQLLGIDIQINGTTFYLGAEQKEEWVEIEFNLFKLIQDTLLTVMGLQKVDNYVSVDPRYAKLKSKIDSVRKNGQTKTNANTNLSETYVVMTYEFGIKPDEVNRMNVYQLNTYMGYVNRSIQYRVSAIAAGNGLSKKVKYITHKGK